MFGNAPPPLEGAAAVVAAPDALEDDEFWLQAASASTANAAVAKRMRDLPRIGAKIAVSGALWYQIHPGFSLRSADPRQICGNAGKPTPGADTMKRIWTAA